MRTNPNVLSQSDYGPIIINRFDNCIGAYIGATGYWGSADIKLIESALGATCANAQEVCVLDIGSNIGTHTLAFAKFHFSNLTVHAFEAQRNIYYMLAGTIALNNLFNVYCHNLAVSNISGQILKIPLIDYSRPCNIGSFELEKAKKSDNNADMYLPGAFDFVKTIRIDDLKLEHVKLIKLDIEGMEDRAVEGAHQTILRCRPMLFIETAKTDFSSIKSFLLANNYNLFQSNTINRDVICMPKETNIGIQGAELIT